VKVVSLQSQKGGAGKTLLAVSLAVAAEIEGLSAVVIDLDPQASASAWGDIRQSERPAIAAIPPARLAHALQAARDAAADIVFVDTAPHAGADALTAARAADLMLVPCRPALFDLLAIAATADIARLAGKPAFAVLNAAPPGASRLIEDAVRAISDHGLPVAPVVISQRAAFAHALTGGLSAQERAPDGAAASEIRALYDWIAATLAAAQRESVKPLNRQSVKTSGKRMKVE
jgi:chromosome partitioning protein